MGARNKVWRNKMYEIKMVVIRSLDGCEFVISKSQFYQWEKKGCVYVADAPSDWEEPSRLVTRWG